MCAGSLRKQRGAETVEFIATLWVILLVFFAFVDLGIAFVDKSVITDASRAAAREVIRGGSDAQAWSAANSVLDSVIVWTGSSPYVCDGATCPIDKSSGTNPGNPITVSVDFTFQPRFFPNLAPLNLSGRTVMRMTPK